MILTWMQNEGEIFMKVLIADGVSAQGIEILEKNFGIVVKGKLRAEEVVATIGEFAGLIVRGAW